MARTPAALAKEPVGGEYANEAAFRRHVRYRARALGWKLYEVPNSIMAHSSGFPDLYLAHPGRGVAAFAECKTNTGRYTADQSEWFDTLIRVGALVFLWRPNGAAGINDFLEGTGEWAR